MSRYGKSIVAAGHKEVCRAAGIILSDGGNAFDAMVAAGFASAVVEPALTSLGGGGLLTGYNSRSGEKLFFDFFVDTPGKGRPLDSDSLDFYPVTVRFSGTDQDFNVGLGSVAVPGTLKGLLHTHKRLGRIPLREVIEPARQLALGHTLNGQQAHFLELLYPIMTVDKSGRRLYEPKGIYLKEGDRLCNPQQADFLERIGAEGDDFFYSGDVAREIAGDMREKGGLVTLEDLAGYEVKERPPLEIPYGAHTFMTASSPSMGGTLIGLSLSLLAEEKCSSEGWGSSDHLLRTVRLMQHVEEKRSQGVTDPRSLLAFLEKGKVYTDDEKPQRLFSRGTTHVSIADSEGNCASMTCSNGEGSGYIVPGTGVMLNNMMGEDDLHPDGFHTTPPGQRVGSMMAPSILFRKGQPVLVIGSGGSKRIRTAISQVVSQVVDFGKDLADAVSAPRLYWDVDKVQVEPGFPAESLAALKALENTVVWEKKDVYFGGVHAVMPGEAGAGDPRRGGAVREVVSR